MTPTPATTTDPDYTITPGIFIAEPASVEGGK